MEVDVTGGWTEWLRAPWRTAARRRTIGSIALSSILHVSALSACALWIFSRHQPSPSLGIRTVWSDAPRPQMTPVEPLPVAVEPDETDEGGVSLGEAVFRQQLGEVGESVAVDDASFAALDTTGQLPTPTVPTQTVGLSGGQGQGKQTGRGRGTGEGESEGAAEGGSFFGLTAEGRRVVYVVDASRSMNHPHPGPMKTRFGRVKLELVRSISGMTSEQEFFIIYFNDQTWPMPANSLRLAIPSVRHKYLQWAVEAKASGTTDPEQALLTALALNPDVIYFLTDGDFKSNVVKHVRQANHQQRITIHTIGFGDDEGELLLKDIAFQNWGTYQFISGAEDADPGS